MEAHSCFGLRKLGAVLEVVLGTFLEPVRDMVLEDVLEEVR